MTDPMRSRGVVGEADTRAWISELEDVALKALAICQERATERDAALARAEAAVQRAGEAARDALQEAGEHHGTRNQRDRALARNRALEEGLQGVLRGINASLEASGDHPHGGLVAAADDLEALLAPAQEDAK